MTRHGFFHRRRNQRIRQKNAGRKGSSYGYEIYQEGLSQIYGTFYAIGVNTVVWVDGEDKIEIDLTDIAKQADMSKIEPAKRPLLNPTLELSGIYFMQELRRPVEKDQHGNLRELEEELIVNLKKSEYLVAMNVDPEDPKKINIPYLKIKRRNSPACIYRRYGT